MHILVSNDDGVLALAHKSQVSGKVSNIEHDSRNWNFYRSLTSSSLYLKLSLITCPYKVVRPE